jgi:hypothetical protein
VLEIQAFNILTSKAMKYSTIITMLTQLEAIPFIERMMINSQQQIKSHHQGYSKVNSTTTKEMMPSLKAGTKEWVIREIKVKLTLIIRMKRFHNKIGIKDMLIL